MLFNTYHFVTLFVKWTGLFAEIDCGSALAIVRVYMSENLGSLEEIMRPVLLKEPCERKHKLAKVYTSCHYEKCWTRTDISRNWQSQFSIVQNKITLPSNLISEAFNNTSILKATHTPKGIVGQITSTASWNICFSDYKHWTAEEQIWKYGQKSGS